MVKKLKLKINKQLDQDLSVRVARLGNHACWGHTCSLPLHLTSRSVCLCPSGKHTKCHSLSTSNKKNRTKPHAFQLIANQKEFCSVLKRKASFVGNKVEREAGTSDLQDSG